MTNKPEMATRTGNTYISETMRDIIEIPMRNLEFMSLKKVSTSDCTAADNWKQQHGTKIGNKTDSIESLTESPAFSTMASLISVANWLWRWPITRSGNVALAKPEIFLSLEIWWTGSKFQQQIWGFWPCWAWRNCPRQLEMAKFWVPSCHFGSSFFVTVAWLHFYRAPHGRKSRSILTLCDIVTMI